MNRLALILLFPLLLLAVAWWMVSYFYTLIVNPERTWRLAVSVDQLANSAFNGNEDETISSRAARHCLGGEADREKWACLLCKLLDLIDNNHCKKSIGT